MPGSDDLRLEGWRARGAAYGAGRVIGGAMGLDEVVPLQARIERVGDDANLEEVYGTERHLLCIACTRTRDRLLVTGVHPSSEFLDDLRSGGMSVPWVSRNPRVRVSVRVSNRFFVEAKVRFSAVSC